MDFVEYCDPQKRSIDRWRDLVNHHAAGSKVPPCALAAIIERESGGDPNAKSADGGWGLCQITAGVDVGGNFTATGMNMLDPDSNVLVAAEYFLAPAIQQCTELRASHGPRMNEISLEILFFAFCSYNAGFGSVRQAIINGQNPDDYTTMRYGAGTLDLYHSALIASHANVPTVAH